MYIYIFSSKSSERILLGYEMSLSIWKVGYFGTWWCPNKPLLRGHKRLL